MISVYDRLIASTSGMVSVLYALASLLLWYLLFFRNKASRKVEKTNGGVDTHRIIVDRAVAWTAFALIFMAFSAIKLGWFQWQDVNLLFVLSTSAVAIAGLFSVYEMTKPRFGKAVLIFFIAAMVLAAVSLWEWG